MKNPKLKFQNPTGSFLPYFYRPENLQKGKEWVKENPELAKERGLELISTLLNGGPSDALYYLYETMHDDIMEGVEKEKSTHTHNYKPLTEEEYIQNINKFDTDPNNPNLYLPHVGRHTSDPILQKSYDYHQAWLDSPKAKEIADRLGYDLEFMKGELSKGNYVPTPKHISSGYKWNNPDTGKSEPMIVGGARGAMFPYIQLNQVRDLKPHSRKMTMIGSKDLTSDDKAKSIAGVKDAMGHELAHLYMLDHYYGYPNKNVPVMDQALYDISMEERGDPSMFRYHKSREGEHSTGEEMVKKGEPQARMSEIRRIFQDNQDIFGVDVFTQDLTEDHFNKMRDFAQDYKKGKLNKVPESIKRSFDRSPNIVTHLLHFQPNTHSKISNSLVMNTDRQPNVQYAKKGGILKPKLKFQEGEVLRINTYAEPNDQGGVYYFTGRPEVGQEGFSDKEIIGMQDYYDFLKKWYQSDRARAMAEKYGSDLDLRIKNMEEGMFGVQNIRPVMEDMYMPMLYQGLATQGGKNPEIDIDRITPERYAELQEHADEIINMPQVGDINVFATTNPSSIDVGKHASSVATPFSYNEELTHVSLLGAKGKEREKNMKPVQKIIPYDIKTIDRMLKEDVDEIEKNNPKLTEIEKEERRSVIEHDRYPIEAQNKLMMMRYIMDTNPEFFGGKDIFTEGISHDDLNALEQYGRQSEDPATRWTIWYILNSLTPDEFVEAEHKIARNTKGNNATYAKKGGILKPKIKFNRS